VVFQRRDKFTFFIHNCNYIQEFLWSFSPYVLIRTVLERATFICGCSVLESKFVLSWREHEKKRI